MENNIEREESGVTLGDIFRMMFSQKWLALAIVIIVTVAGTLTFYFKGKLDEVYSVSFVLQLPNAGDATSTSYTYPDGESFYFTDLVSQEKLNAVASLNEFKKIDVSKMIKNGDVSIIRTIDKLDEDNQEGGVYDLNYTIKLKAKYFANEDLARNFVKTITSSPYDYIRSMDINYDQSLTTSRSAITYEEQLGLLKSQAYYIQANYNELIGAHGREFVVEGGKTLAQYKDEIDTYLSQDLFTALITNAKENGYVKANNEAKLKYESDK